jgi:hypothetical protein
MLDFCEVPNGSSEPKDIDLFDNHENFLLLFNSSRLMFGEDFEPFERDIPDKDINDARLYRAPCSETDTGATDEGDGVSL